MSMAGEAGSIRNACRNGDMLLPLRESEKEPCTITCRPAYGPGSQLPSLPLQLHFQQVACQEGGVWASDAVSREVRDNVQ